MPSRSLRATFSCAARIAVLASLLAGVVAAPASASLQPLDGWGGLGNGTGQLGAGASGIAVTPAGRVLVADSANQRIQSFAPDGTSTGTFGGLGSGQPRLNEPVGIAVDSASRIFVTEAQGDRLHRYTADGTALGTDGGHGTGPGQLSNPAGVAVARDGSVLVVDRGNDRIQVYAPTGGVLGGWGARTFTDPYGIAVAPSGDVYVTDRGARRVLRFAADGTFKDAFDGTGTAAGRLVEPAGIAVDRTGAVHVADAARHVVVTFAADGSTTALAPDAPLASPSGLATDCRASLYVVGSADGSVRRFGRAGAVPPPCSPPRPAFTSTPEIVPFGGQVFFDASASRDDGRIVRMDWDLDGDGVFEAADRGASVAQTFSKVGGLPVTLRVTDDDGEQAAVTQALTVAPGATAAARVVSMGPTLGVTLLAQTVSGTVRFRRPGAQATERLTALTLLPLGTRFDTTDGRARLTLATGKNPATQSGVFWDGIFTVFQGTASPLTELVLAEATEEEAATPSKAKKRARTAARGKKRSRLWGDAKGNFRTSGRNAAATVRGTRWLTEEDADGTAVQVGEGRVTVQDFVTGRTVEVKKGDRYTARDACASRRDFRIRLRIPVGLQLRSATVTVNGRRVPVRPLKGRLTAFVDLRGRTQGRQVVRITLVATNGARVTGTRTYATCSDERRKSAPPRV